MEAGATRIKVPVAAAVAAAWRAVLGRPGLVLELGWLSLLLLMAALLLPELALRYLAPTGLGAMPRGGFVPAESIFAEAVSLLALSAFAVRWYRQMLTGSGRLAPRLFAGAWLRFILYSLAFYAAGIGFAAAVWYSGIAEPDAPAALAGGGNVAAAAVAAALLLGMARVSLLFPAAALGAPLALGAAWRAMRGNAWRLLLVSVAAALPVMLAEVVLIGPLLAAAHLGPNEVVAPDPPLGFVLLSGVIEAVIRLLLTALGASVLSDFYRRIVLQRKEALR
ncbi:MAG TPA: hypothetical protein VE397_19805 [Stellaceae bacterium]|jgi:hypothetical protein|nr:hypothetical protein [Stellaceae bacterium]